MQIMQKLRISYISDFSHRSYRIPATNPGSGSFSSKARSRRKAVTSRLSNTTNTELAVRGHPAAPRRAARAAEWASAAPAPRRGGCSATSPARPGPSQPPPRPGPAPPRAPPQRSVPCRSAPPPDPVCGGPPGGAPLAPGPAQPAAAIGWGGGVYSPARSGGRAWHRVTLSGPRRRRRGRPVRRVNGPERLQLEVGISGKRQKDPSRRERRAKPPLQRCS